MITLRMKPESQQRHLLPRAVVCLPKSHLRPVQQSQPQPHLRHASAFLARWLAAVLCFGLLASCSSTPKTAADCAKTNWAALGERAVEGGEPLANAWGRRSGECVALGIQPDHVAFEAAYFRGIPAYCQLRNALVIGRQGGNYRGICGAPGDALFRQVLDFGQLLRQVDEDVAQINRQLSSAESVMRDEKAKEGERRIARANLLALPTARQDALGRRAQLEAQAVQKGWGLGR